MRWDRGSDVIDGSRLSAMTRSVDEVGGWLRGRGHTGETWARVCACAINCACCAAIISIIACGSRSGLTRRSGV